MPIYTPVNAGFRAETYESELLAFRLNGPGILGPGFTADFLLSKSLSQMLSVTFSADSIVRILDEFPLSSEGNDGENIGLIPNVFAYTVSGTTFESSQSEAGGTGGVRSTIDFQQITCASMS